VVLVVSVEALRFTGCRSCIICMGLPPTVNLQLSTTMAAGAVQGNHVPSRLEPKHAPGSCQTALDRFAFSTQGDFQIIFARFLLLLRLLLLLLLLLPAN